jgi:hypothetical protein
VDQLAAGGIDAFLAAEAADEDEAGGPHLKAGWDSDYLLQILATLSMRLPRDSSPG